MKTHVENGHEYITISGEEVEVDGTGIVNPELYADDIIAAFDAIGNIELTDGTIIS